MTLHQKLVLKIPQFLILDLLCSLIYIYLARGRYYGLLIAGFTHDIILEDHDMMSHNEAAIY